MFGIERTGLLAFVLAGALGCGPAASVEPVDDGDVMAGETTGCSKASCTDGIHLSLVSDAATFTAGGYTVSFTQGDIEQACGFELLGGMEACGFEATCLGEADCDAGFTLQGANQSIAFFVVTPGAGSNGSTGSPSTTSTSTGEGEPPIEIVVSREGQVLVAEAVFPLYEVVAPNGPGCEPVCNIGQAIIGVPP